MKKTIQFLFALAILSLTAIAVQAQPPGGQGGPRGGMNGDPAQRAERQASLIKEQLALDDELTAEIQEVFTVYGKKMQEARAAANGDRMAMRETMQNLRKEQDEELEAILGEEKWTEFVAKRDEMMQRRQERRRGDGEGRRKGKKKKDTSKT